MPDEPWTPAYARLFDPGHELAGDKACRRWAWLDLCHLASYRDHKRVVQGRVVTIRRGEFVASIRFLAARWGWSKDKVRRFLVLLESEPCCKIETVDTTRDGTLYRVVEYDTYRASRDSDEHAGGTPTGRKRDANGTVTGQRKEVKEGIKAVEDSSAVPAQATRKRERATQLPADWQPTAEHRARAKAEGVNVDREAEKFRLHAEAKARKAVRWNAAFTTWLIRAAEMGGGNGTGHAASPIPELEFDGDGIFRVHRR